ncbi:MAG TPA: hypothetical protein VMF51_03010 [Nocardioides sp.]|uniref:DUF7144 family membrane protein n=1 Tax=Nocardioides sp. TaxID=35761 RepID=UPI002C835F22|nr:hypothetical protein [Nocardioides sp.]HTW14069.1 hypothetical protein [Nocardioides sp.]
MTEETTARSDPAAAIDPSRWYGLLAFAGMIMLMLGAFHAMAGLVALFEEDHYLVAQDGLVVSADYTVWGWTHLVLGVVIAVAGGALLSGAAWARVVAAVIALVSALVNLAFLPAYPLWAAIMIALDVLILYAVTTHRGDSRR